MADDPLTGKDESEDESTTEGPNDDTGVVIDGAWAILLATDDEEQALAVHRRLVAGDVDAHVRDVEESEREPGEPSIQVIVPVEDAPAALVELELLDGLGSARPDPGQVERVRSLGYEIDDLAIAELSATGGPQYGLDELGDEYDIETFLEALEAERIRFALDRSANVIVHYNDEAKVDQLIDRLCDDSDLDEAFKRGSDVPSSEQNSLGSARDEDREKSTPGSDASDANSAGIDDPMVVVVSRPASVVGPTAAVSDLEGRPAVDDVTPEHGVISKPGPPAWIYVVAVLIVVVLLILAVL